MHIVFAEVFELRKSRAQENKGKVIHWLEVHGHDTQLMHLLRDHFGLDDNAVEASLDPKQMPLVRCYSGNMFFVLRTLGLDPDAPKSKPHRLIEEYVSVFYVFGQEVNTIITVQVPNITANKSNNTMWYYLHL